MRAFLSYSLNDNDQFVIPLVSSQLQEQGFFVTNGSYHITNQNARHSVNEINKANLFIGIITNTGNSNDRVYNEWRFGLNSGTPSVLLVEENYPLHSELNGNPNIIQFNRYEPNSAIESIRNRARNVGSRSNTSSDAVPWILGGIALITILNLLSKDE